MLSESMSFGEPCHDDMAHSFENSTPCLRQGHDCSKTNTIGRCICLVHIERCRCSFSVGMHA